MRKWSHETIKYFMSDERDFGSEEAACLRKYRFASLTHQHGCNTSTMQHNLLFALVRYLHVVRLYFSQRLPEPE